MAGDTATYPDVAPGTDLTVTVTSDGYEFSLIVKTAPVVKNPSYTVPLNLTGLSASMTAGGNLQLRDGKGALQVSFTPPVLFDSFKDAVGQPHRGKVSWGLTGAVGAQSVVITPDPAFFADPSTVYPAVVDPSASYGRSADTYIQASNAATNFAGSVSLLTGSTNGGADRSRSLLTFNTGYLTNKHIQSATLNLWNYGAGACYTGSSSATPTYVYPITAAWSPSAVTWSTNPTLSTTAAARFDQSRNGGPTCTAGTTPSSDMSGLVQAWGDGALANYGLELVASTDANTAAYRNFYSGEHVGGQPALVITYNSYPTTPMGRSVTPAAYVGSTYNATSLTPTLRASSSSPDGAQTRVDFEIWNSGHTGAALFTGSSAYGASNSPRSWTPPAPLSQGVTYEWRAKGFDGVSQSKVWSSWIVFKPDTQAPATPTGLTSSQYPSGV